ncbi:MAG TPA: DUF951 domain-containing protein [Dehalococcoidia bacterium]|nr:DUF951 domain-containing protein [SAR202 cluster bacterium]HBD84075.1 DUF951 domain-containing protein [Dehalococcoidia bacterium]HBJ31844.1 DUF951 domain-containing protein [Dehalococcoidia bacterium]
MVTPYELGWVVRLKKKHPCGNTDWEIVRLGADIGIVCLGCKRRVLMPRSTLDKRLRTVVSSDEQPANTESGS